MKLSRTTLGLAVRAARDAAGLTLNDLAGIAGMTPSSLSRSENGLRDLSFEEAVAIAAAVHVDVQTLRTLAETFELEGVAEKSSAQAALKQDLYLLQRKAVEVAIEARSLTIGAGGNSD